jgi:predicted dehydrogenase|tara:strand:+ start:3162 stop:4508 length:1347 start_codon:yes stop_codon:yes gene_type:complete
MNKRRDFIKKTSTGLLAGSLLSPFHNTSAKSYSKIIGANNRIIIAFQGLGRRFPGLLNSSLKMKNIEIKYFCDVMDKQIEKANKRYNNLKGEKAISEKNIHRIIEDKDVNSIIIATPDHWHAYAACKAMSAGKHVYLEKPCSHNLKESELLVNYQSYYNKVVQMGNQQRSSYETLDIINLIHNGIIGDVYRAETFYNNNRPRVPNQVIEEIPKGLDWDLFQGPSKRKLYTYDTWDYNWRWYGWDFGTGEAGNNATHELDIARWALKVNYPNKVDVYAGKNHFKNDGWTMYDTMEAKFHFPNNLRIDWNCQSRNSYAKKLEGGRGTIVYGSKGSVFINRQGYQIYDLNGKKIKNSISSDNESSTSLGGGGNMTTKHFRNFFNSIRNGEKLTSPIDDAVISQSMVHYANLAYRANKSFDIDPVSGNILDKKIKKKFWSREYEPGWEIKPV